MTCNELQTVVLQTMGSLPIHDQHVSRHSWGAMFTVVTALAMTLVLFIVMGIKYVGIKDKVSTDLVEKDIKYKESTSNNAFVLAFSSGALPFLALIALFGMGRFYHSHIHMRDVVGASTEQVRRFNNAFGVSMVFVLGVLACTILSVVGTVNAIDNINAVLFREDYEEHRDAISNSLTNIIIGSATGVGCILVSFTLVVIAYHIMHEAPQKSGAPSRVGAGSSGGGGRAALHA